MRYHPDYPQRVIRCLPKYQKRRMALLALQGTTIKCHPVPHHHGRRVWFVTSSNMADTDLGRLIDRVWCDELRNVMRADNVMPREQAKRELLMSAYGGRAARRGTPDWPAALRAKITATVNRAARPAAMAEEQK